MRTIAIVFAGTIIGVLAAAPAASARPGGGHGTGVGGKPSFAGRADGRPVWQGSNPPGFSMGQKSGWNDSVPPGWHKGRKKGWKNNSVPPGLFRR